MSIGSNAYIIGCDLWSGTTLLLTALVDFLRLRPCSRHLLWSAASLLTTLVDYLRLVFSWGDLCSLSRLSFPFRMLTCCYFLCSLLFLPGQLVGRIQSQLLVVGGALHDILENIPGLAKSLKCNSGVFARVLIWVNL